jgi:hypothetical protein
MILQVEESWLFQIIMLQQLQTALQKNFDQIRLIYSVFQTCTLDDLCLIC